jgi:hypothetical protein
MKIGSMLEEIPGKKFDIASIVKPTAPLENVVEDFGKLGKTFIKQHHIALLGRPGTAWIGIIITQ